MHHTTGSALRAVYPLLDSQSSQLPRKKVAKYHPIAEAQRSQATSQGSHSKAR